MKKLTLLIFAIIFLIPKIPVKAASASFYTTGGDTIYSGTQFNVSIYANGDEAYNAVTVNVNFGDLVFVGASGGAGWTGVSGPYLSGNRVIFSAALLGSSATGSSNVLNVTFRALNYPSSGTIQSFGTIALADGSGTPVDGGGNLVTYTVIDPPPPPPAPDPPPNAVTVTSSTHPTQDSWYNTAAAVINWNKQDGVEGFSYILDTATDTNPDDTLENAETTLNVPALTEGRNYFHIKAKNAVGFSSVTHFAINYDKTSPNPFGIAKIENNDKSKFIIYFATNDNLAGVSHFTVKLDETDLGKKSTGLEVDKTVYKAFVTAVDKAGNSRTEEVVITEPVPTESEAPVTGSLTLPEWLAPAILATVTGLGFIIILILIAKRIIKRQNQKRKKMLETPETT